MTTLDFVRIALEFLIVPIFGMVWSTQGRISRMEGEIKALYTIIELFKDSKK
jgi:hypothetical protein